MSPQCPAQSPYLRYHLLLSVVFKEGVPRGPAHGWGGVETVRKTIAPGEQEEEGEKVGDESHHLGQADPPAGYLLR